MDSVLKERFESGNGVVTLQANMPDAAILATIKYAAQYGKPFIVIPSGLPSDDAHFEGQAQLELHPRFQDTAMHGPLNETP